jgi:hypothetical protein
LAAWAAGNGFSTCKARLLWGWAATAAGGGADDERGDSVGIGREDVETLLVDEDSEDDVDDRPSTAELLYKALPVPRRLSSSTGLKKSAAELSAAALLVDGCSSCCVPPL